MSDTKKLPVFASLGEVLSGVTRHYFQLLAVAWPAVVILLAVVGFVVWQFDRVGLLQAYVANNGAPDPVAIQAAFLQLSASGATLSIVFAYLLIVIASTVAAVRWHRFVLLGEGATNLSAVRLFRAEDGRYLWSLIKIFGLMIVAMLVVVLVASFVGTVVRTFGLNIYFTVALAVAAFALYLWGYSLLFRLMLALPDASVGRGGRVFAVFAESAGNGWRLFGLFFLVVLVYAVASYVIFRVAALIAGAFGVHDISSPAVLIPAILLYLALYTFAVMTQVTMLSVAYREIIGLPAKDNAAEPV